MSSVCPIETIHLAFSQATSLGSESHQDHQEMLKGFQVFRKMYLTAFDLIALDGCKRSIYTTLA